MRWRAWGSSLLKICPHRYSQASKAHPHSAKVWSCTLFYFSTESLQWPATAFGSEVLHKTNGKYCHQKPACCNKSNLPLCQSPPSPVLGKQSNFCASQFFQLLALAHFRFVFPINIFQMNTSIVIASSFHPKKVAINSWSSLLFCKLSEESIEVYEIVPPCSLTGWGCVRFCTSEFSTPNEFSAVQQIHGRGEGF